MQLYDKLKSLLTSGRDDGTKELAAQHMQLLSDAAEMEELMQSPGFAKLIMQLRGDFESRLLEIADKDPDLKAMRRMLIRTLGLKGAEEQIRKALESISGGDIDV